MRFQEIKRYIIPKTILDIGANVGQFAVAIAKEFPSSSITCVEGNVECIKYLEDQTNVLPQLQTIHLALLSDSEKEVTYYTRVTDPTATGNSIYKELTPFYSIVETKEVVLRTQTLDNLFEGQSFDLIKIDTQGSELDIIKGGRKVVENAKALILEVAIEAYNEGAPFYSEVKSFVTELGFTREVHLGDNLHPLNGKIVQYDVMFLREDV